MTAPLYARYIPPKPKPAPSNGESAIRDRAADEDHTNSEKAPESLKRKRTTHGAENSKKSKQAKTTENVSKADAAVPESQVNRQEGSSRSVDGAAEDTGAQADDQLGRESKMVTKKPKRRKDKQPPATQISTNTADDMEDRKHASVMSKFQKSVKTPVQEQAPGAVVEPEAEIQADQVRELKPFERPKRESLGTPLNAFDVLPSWISKPTRAKGEATVAFKELDLHEDNVKLLQRKGFERALPVQTAVLPLLLPTPKQHPGDICVSAATGSGKTLAYVLPIIQSLVKRPAPGLRAVIVVPTRELVKQVQDTLASFVQGTGLRVETASGVQHIKDEQAAVVGQEQRFDEDKLTGAKRSAEDSADSRFDDESEFEDWDKLNDPTRDEPETLPFHTLHYFSKADILIATPGRLVDHVKQTKGFTLQNLEWLVIDEADRLLDASFQDWVATITDAMAVERQTNDVDSPWLLRTRPERHNVRKVMLSATMTRDLQKLAALKLRNPRLVVVEGGEALEDGADSRDRDDGALVLPTELVEYGVPVGDGSEKPLHLLRLLERILAPEAEDIPHMANPAQESIRGDDAASDSDSDASDSSSVLSDSDESSTSSTSPTSSTPPPASHSHTSPATTPPTRQSNALIFTAATDTANRLAAILKHLRPEWAPQTASITKSGTSSATTKAISRFQAGKVRILIATDRVSRGLDLPHLTDVINYDIPHSVNSYVHRVGRTARAGNAGTAWTLLEDRQARWFWKEEIATKAKIERGSKTLAKVRMDVRDGMRKGYGEALSDLEKNVKGN